jgi:hypothetical protein
VTFTFVGATARRIVGVEMRQRQSTSPRRVVRKCRASSRVALHRRQRKPSG